jgi:galactofuranose transport system permease protein
MSARAKMLGRNLPLLVTGAIFLLLFGVAAKLYDNFFSARVVLTLLRDNAPLGVVAIGMTLVIFSGGIDLSVGAVIGFTSIFTATLIVGHGVAPVWAWGLALALGAGFGAGLGALICVFGMPPFLATLAGMFFARGVAFWVSEESVSVPHPWYAWLSNFDLAIGDSVHVSALAIMLVAVMLAGWVVAHHTRYGRTLLAVGGSEQSALLMGLPVRPAKISVYALSGLLAALAGIMASFDSGAGNASAGVGIELDAIAVVVVGGTLLTGGRGHMLGTLLGLLIVGTIQQAILFDGRLDSAWMRIVVGALLLAFILLQRFLVRGLARRG